MNKGIIKKLLREKVDFAFFVNIKGCGKLRVHSHVEHGSNVEIEHLRCDDGLICFQDITQVFRLVEVE